MPNIHRIDQTLLYVSQVLATITAATATGAAIDLEADGADSALFEFQGSPTGASTTVDGKVQESADNSTWADVTSSNITQITTAGASGGTVMELVAVDCRKRKRYLRASMTGAGAAAAGGMACSVQLARERQLPPTQSSTVVSV